MLTTGRLFGAATAMLSVSTMLAVWVSSVHYLGEKGTAPPRCLFALVNGPLACMLCLKSARKLVKRPVSIIRLYNK